MEIKNKAWYMASKAFGMISVAGMMWLFVDAWILGDAGPDKPWFLEALVTGIMFGFCLFAEAKAGVKHFRGQLPTT